MRRPRVVPVLVGLALAGTLGCGRRSVELFGACDGCGPSPDGSVASLALRDPERCGADEEHCEDDEYCVAGACVCREGLVLDGEDCVDPMADAEHCGTSGEDCANVCEDGACVSACRAGRLDCEGGCVDVSRHPLHCGECGRPCGANQVCIDGLCRVFAPVLDCGSCADACCTYPTRPDDRICVEGAGC
ncbi:MAG TPA: hypothetical protein RMH99_18720 [Sandaracinaceae bacterium LLY-WYZ-13_1]|nr:hypothetical protein [Sandaracinaceae bacterium LLY-WYZ-13_1]